MLIAEKAKIQKKIEDKRAALEEEMLEECSFQPIIEQMPEEFRVYGVFDKEDLTAEYFKHVNDPKFRNTHKGVILHDLSKKVKEKKEIIANEIKQQELEKELENCTFAPKLEERIFPQDFSPDEFKSSLVSQSKASFKGKINTEAKNKNFDNKKNSFSQGPKTIKLESNDGEIAVFAISVGNVVEKLKFNVKNDDPTSQVLEFSKNFGLSKGDEYRLVKELTLVKEIP